MNSATSLPDFDHTLALGHGNLDAASLSECHGVACGLLARSPDSSGDAFFALLAMLEVVREPGPGLREALDELRLAAGQQLADEELGFMLWLPTDDEPLADRTEALSQWCSGFLAALGAGQADQLKTLSAEGAEALVDLREIARAGVEEASPADSVAEPDEDPGRPDEEGRDEHEGDGQEQAFAEIVEYIRIAVLVLREDLRGPLAGESVH
jgi:uncharacterized protein YgfB (UPF0149 family)